MPTITVDTLSDVTAVDGFTTLREAIDQATSGDTIEFASGLSGGTITLTQGVISLAKDVTINGDVTGADNKADITIDGNGAQIFSAISSAEVNLASLTFTGGGGTQGGAINSFTAKLTVDYSTFTGNGGANTTSGGAIYAQGGTLAINNSTFSSNHVGGFTLGGNGGAILIQGLALTATNTTFIANTVTGAVNNYGGAIAGFGSSTSSISLINSTLTGNIAGVGGGIWSNSTLNTLTNTIVSGNTAATDPNVRGSFTDNGGNVIDGTVADIFDGGVGTLADNGGPVDTVALLDSATNPALDVGPGSATDARGEARFDVPGVDNDPSGTDIADAGAYELLCFAQGTHIATPTGEQPVESLSPGDLVRTADGRDVPVIWIGCQTLDPAAAMSPRNAPVRIETGALGHGLPTRDLVVTIDYALALEGLLINAGVLVGAPGIDCLPPSQLSAGFTVYHVETDAHEILLAEGAPTESFCDVAGRRAFANHATAPTCIIPEMSLPRISSRRLLPEALRQRFPERAETCFEFIRTS